MSAKETDLNLFQMRCLLRKMLWKSKKNRAA